MRKTILRLLAAASFVIIAGNTAYAYNLLNPARRWFAPDVPHNVRIDNGGVASVTGGDPDHGVTACLNAVTSWNDGTVTVTSSSSANVAYVQGDGISDVKFSDPLGICTGTCLAATLTGYYNTSITGTCDGLNVVKITDADVSFNLSYNYTTPAQGSCSSEIYLNSVLAHEVGHVIGLAHSNTSSALMYASVAYCSNKAVGADDLAGRNALYDCGGACSPAGASCNSNSDCCSNSCKGKPGSKTCR
jgi:hypothetical protein